MCMCAWGEQSYPHTLILTLYIITLIASLILTLSPSPPHLPPHILTLTSSHSHPHSLTWPLTYSPLHPHTFTLTSSHPSLSSSHSHCSSESQRWILSLPPCPLWWTRGLVPSRGGVRGLLGEGVNQSSADLSRLWKNGGGGGGGGKIREWIIIVMRKMQLSQCIYKVHCDHDNLPCKLKFHIVSLMASTDMSVIRHCLVLTHLSNSWKDWKEATVPVRWQGTTWMLWNLLKFVRSSLKL